MEINDTWKSESGFRLESDVHVKEINDGLLCLYKHPFDADTYRLYFKENIDNGDLHHLFDFKTTEEYALEIERLAYWILEIKKKRKKDDLEFS